MDYLAKTKCSLSGDTSKSEKVQKKVTSMISRINNDRELDKFRKSIKADNCQGKNPNAKNMNFLSKKMRLAF